MKTKRDNKIIFDLKKAQYARFFYRNQHGHTRNTLTLDVTYYGESVMVNEMALHHPDYPGETVLERYERRQIEPDHWEPVMFFKLTANCALEFTGAKALALRAAWGEYIFKK